MRKVPKHILSFLIIGFVSVIALKTCEAQITDEQATKAFNEVLKINNLTNIKLKISDEDKIIARAIYGSRTIVISRKHINFMPNIESLYFVLGHEAGHLHYNNKVGCTRKTEDPKIREQSYKNEYSADDYGIRTVMKLKLDVNKAVMWFDKLNLLTTILTCHPDLEVRKAKVLELKQENL